jgi:hypothetical protein
LSLYLPTGISRRTIQYSKTFKNDAVHFYNKKFKLILRREKKCRTGSTKGFKPQRQFRSEDFSREKWFKNSTLFTDALWEKSKNDSLRLLKFSPQSGFIKTAPSKIVCNHLLEDDFQIV